jgi:hypothetical protein
VGQQLNQDCRALFGVDCEGYHQAGKRLSPQQQSDPVSLSLVAKYAPSPKKRFDKAYGGCRLLFEHLGMNERSYRWMIADMRQQLGIAERLMSAGQWQDLQYAKLPSVCLKNHCQAFQRHDDERWSDFRQQVVAKKTKVNVGQLSPCELVQVLRREPDENMEMLLGAFIQQHGPALSHAVVVADTSGSMQHGSSPMAPIDVCLALALLASEGNTGSMRHKYLAFSSESEEVTIMGTTYHEKIASMLAGPWGMSTNLQAAFDLILVKMVTGEKIRSIIIISDMQFDACGAAHTNFQEIDARFAEAGLQRPVLVFWNVSAQGQDVPVCRDARGVILVSGYSPSLFQLLVDAPADINPERFVQQIIDDDKYARITLPTDGKRRSAPPSTPLFSPTSPSYFPPRDTGDSAKRTRSG